MDTKTHTHKLLESFVEESHHQAQTTNDVNRKVARRQVMIGAVRDWGEFVKTHIYGPIRRPEA